MSREIYEITPVEFTEYDDLGALLAAARDRMDALEGSGIPFEIIDLSVRGELGIKTEHRQDNYVLSSYGVRSYNDSRKVARKKRLWGNTRSTWYDSDLPRIPSAPMLPGAIGETSHDGALHLYRFDSLPESYVPDDPSPQNVGTLGDLVALGFNGSDIAHIRETGPLGRALANGIGGVVEMFVFIGGDLFVWSAPLTVR